MNLIVAADRNWGIGYQGGLLCHLSGDLKNFKETTMGHTVVMGRSTLESLPGKKGLPGRRNIVLSRQPHYGAPGVERVVHTMMELTILLSRDQDAFVIGGAEVYKQLLPLCDTCYVTKIDAEFPADCWFPNLDEDPAFELAWQSDEMEENGIRYRFLRYERKQR